MKTTEQTTEISKLAEKWEQLYSISLPTAKQKQIRLAELESWDTSNGHPIERAAKIKALENLLY
jgi:hypothetical protein